jgi:hypothetical protein
VSIAKRARKEVNDIKDRAKNRQKIAGPTVRTLGIALLLFSGSTTEPLQHCIGLVVEPENNIGGDATKAAAFRDQALGQQAFRAFAFMKSRSPVIHMAHSVGTFFGMSGMVTNVQGKQIAFVGDRGNAATQYCSYSLHKIHGRGQRCATSATRRNLANSTATPTTKKVVGHQSN